MVPISRNKTEYRDCFVSNVKPGGVVAVVVRNEVYEELF